MGYRVKTVSAMTGIPRGTLLAWERRHDILDPRRTVAGYREYTDEDVAVLRRLKGLVEEGYSISEAVELERARSVAVPAPPVVSVVPAAELVERVLAALVGFDRAEADRLVPRIGQVAFRAAIQELYVPVLQRLGEAWARGDVSIAQEHFVSGFCREQLLAMFHALGGGPERGPAVTCATPPGERHELGLLVVALELALAGNRVVWLGADLPERELCAYLAARPPRFACLSFTLEVGRAEALAFARKVREAAPVRTELVLGGVGLQGVDDPGIDGVRILRSPAELLALVAQGGVLSVPGSPSRP